MTADQSIIQDGAIQHEVSMGTMDILSLAGAVAIGVFFGLALFEAAKAI